MTPYSFVLALHLIAMSVWMGGGLLAPADVRTILTSPAPSIRELLRRLRRTAKLMNGAAYATVFTGIALIAVGRGFAHTPLRIWLGLGLTLLAIGLGRWLIRPAVTAIAESLEAPLAPREAERIASRFAFGVHTESVVRVFVLFLMVA